MARTVPADLLARIKPRAVIWHSSYAVSDTLLKPTLSKRAFPKALPPVHGDWSGAGSSAQRTLFSAADRTYFEEHAMPLVCSANHFSANTRIHLHLYDPAPDTGERLAALRSRAPDSILTSTWERLPGRHGKRYRGAYYAAMRFVRLYQFLQHVEEVVMVDIDSLFRGPVETVFAAVAGADIGIHLRPEQGDRRRKIAAGTFYCRNSEAGRRFMEDLALRISWHMLGLFGCARWYLDQRCLYDVYERYVLRDERLKFGFFSNRFSDWEFSEDSVIWAGKAETKHKDARYLEWADRVAARRRKPAANES